MSATMPCLPSWMPNRSGEEDLASACSSARAVVEQMAAAQSVPVAESRPDTFEPSWDVRWIGSRIPSASRLGVQPAERWFSRSGSGIVNQVANRFAAHEGKGGWI
jgi:hypothetical protein